MAAKPEENEIDELAHNIDLLSEALDTHDRELADLFDDMIQVRDALEKGLLRREEIRTQASLESKDLEYISAILQTLRGHGIVDTWGRGDGWRYTGGESESMLNDFR